MPRKKEPSAPPPQTPPTKFAQWNGSPRASGAANGMGASSGSRGAGAGRPRGSTVACSPSAASLRVFVRVRPQTEGERRSGAARIVSAREQRVLLVNPKAFVGAPVDTVAALAAMVSSSSAASNGSYLSSPETGGGAGGGGPKRVNDWAKVFDVDECLWSVNRSNADDDGERTMEYADQITTYQHVGADIVRDFMASGISCACLAHGESGSGKSYTMMGSLIEEVAWRLFGEEPEQPRIGEAGDGSFAAEEPPSSGGSNRGKRKDRGRRSNNNNTNSNNEGPANEQERRPAWEDGQLRLDHDEAFGLTPRVFCSILRVLRAKMAAAGRGSAKSASPASVAQGSATASGSTTAAAAAALGFDDQEDELDLENNMNGGTGNDGPDENGTGDSNDNDGPPAPGSVLISFVEICYHKGQEHIRDLLNPSDHAKKKASQAIREDATLGHYIPELTKVVAENESNILQILWAGAKRREQGGSAFRSHAVATLHLPNQPMVRVQMVDLAASDRETASGDSMHHSDDPGEDSSVGSMTLSGSELPAARRSGTPRSVTKNRDLRRDRINIRKSLNTLSSVLRKLASREVIGGTARDTALTRLLNLTSARTTVIGTISPSSSSHQETLNTLTYVSSIGNARYSRGALRRVMASDTPDPSLSRYFETDLADMLEELGGSQRGSLASQQLLTAIVSDPQQRLAKLQQQQQQQQQQQHPQLQQPPPQQQQQQHLSQAGQAMMSPSPRSSTAGRIAATSGTASRQLQMMATPGADSMQSPGALQEFFHRGTPAEEREYRSLQEKFVDIQMQLNGVKVDRDVAVAERDQMRSELQRLRAESAEQFDTSMHEVRSQLDTVQGERSRLVGAVESLQVENGRLAAQIRSDREKADALIQQLRKRISILQQDNTLLTTTGKEKHTVIDQLKTEREELRQRLASQVEGSEALQSKYEETLHKLNLHEAAMAQSRSHIRDLEERLERSVSETTTLRREMQHTTTDKETVEHRLSEARHALEEARVMSEKHRQDGDTIDQLELQLRKAVSEKEQLASLVSAQEEMMGAHKVQTSASIKMLEERHESLRRADTEHQRLLDQVQTLQSEQRRLQAELDEATNEKLQLQQNAHSQAQQIQDLSEQNKHFKEMQAYQEMEESHRVQRQRQQDEQLHHDRQLQQEHHERLLGQVQSLQAEQRRLQGDLDVAGREKERLQQTVQALNGQLQQMQQQVQQQAQQAQAAATPALDPSMRPTSGGSVSEAQLQEVREEKEFIERTQEQRNQQHEQELEQAMQTIKELQSQLQQARREKNDAEQSRNRKSQQQDQQLVHELEKARESVRDLQEEVQQLREEKDRIERAQEQQAQQHEQESQKAKQEHSRETAALWLAINKLDMLESAKESALKEMKEERDRARTDLQMALSHVRQLTEQVAELKRELAEIDNQLVDATAKEGIDVAAAISNTATARALSRQSSASGLSGGSGTTTGAAVTVSSVGGIGSGGVGVGGTGAVGTGGEVVSQQQLEQQIHDLSNFLEQDEERARTMERERGAPSQRPPSLFHAYSGAHT